MNLIVDVGNTRIKLAVFDKNRLLEIRIADSFTILETLKQLKLDYPKLNLAIVSSVGYLQDKVLQYLGLQFELTILDNNTKVPFTNLYATPKTLGIDRIALVCASVQQFSQKNVLIIDAGTCITYDFINKDNEYLGGAISPGVRMRYEALHNQTANLPLLETEMPIQIIGNSTIGSINSGIIYGVLNEIDGIIEQYSALYLDLTIILTGGDANFLSKQLKSSIFANSNFLLEGLNYILQHNTVE
ncbi:type III pantothenate kinase [Olleya sp. YSTF-M6]|uniref:Type III pantothenate kinase n=1 Tax=Olleya sediminilitoris TaxID=2795739 RepID=A0ABS1WIZ4_9FLAO|nr:type III pantothenate kinase [Olleya sediminilitoris]MBL7559067.1 type III pantothenate kinase [Olleya sediminilitoris]